MAWSAALSLLSPGGHAFPAFRFSQPVYSTGNVTFPLGIPAAVIRIAAISSVSNSQLQVQPRPG